MTGRPRTAKVSNTGHHPKEDMQKQPKAKAVPISQVRHLSLKGVLMWLVCHQVLIGCKEEKHAQVSLREEEGQSVSHPTRLLQRLGQLQVTQQACQQLGSSVGTLSDALTKGSYSSTLGLHHHGDSTSGSGLFLCCPHSLSVSAGSQSCSFMAPTHHSWY